MQSISTMCMQVCSIDVSRTKKSLTMDTGTKLVYFSLLLRLSQAFFNIVLGVIFSGLFPTQSRLSMSVLFLTEHFFRGRALPIVRSFKNGGHEKKTFLPFNLSSSPSEEDTGFLFLLQFDFFFTVPPPRGLQAAFGVGFTVLQQSQQQSALVCVASCCCSWFSFSFLRYFLQLFLP